jgi:hypothetical protein
MLPWRGSRRVRVIDLDAARELPANTGLRRLHGGGSAALGVTLTRSERSPIAALVTEMLEGTAA